MCTDDLEKRDEFQRSERMLGSLPGRLRLKLGLICLGLGIRHDCLGNQLKKAETIDRNVAHGARHDSECIIFTF